MNLTLNQDNDFVLQADVAETDSSIKELQIVELAYIGGGMANFSFA
jgi:hypothetical protein